MADSSFTHLVVVGSSAGGIGALSGMVSSLPEDFDAPIVVAQHLDPNRESHLQEILARKSPLPVKTVTEHEPLQAGGTVIIQDPETAEFGEMPRSLAPSTVDIVTSLEEIGPVLKNLISGIAIPEEPSEDDGQDLERFLEQLHRNRGIDFRSYKRPTRWASPTRASSSTRRWWRKIRNGPTASCTRPKR